MRRLTIAFGSLLLAGALTWTAQAGAGQPGPTRDEAAVRGVVERYMAARASQEGAAIGAVFTPDADQYTTSGQWRRGREAVVAGTLEASRRNPGERAIRVEAVRFLTDEVAVVDGPYTIGTREVWTTLVVVRADGVWRVAAIRNMAPGS